MQSAILELKLTSAIALLSWGTKGLVFVKYFYAIEENLTEIVDVETNEDKTTIKLLSLHAKKFCEENGLTLFSY